MAADLPPSSRLSRFNPAPAAAPISRPARVDPVKDTMSMPGCLASAWPTSGPAPWTRLKTPSGSRASAIASASRKALSGAISEGLSTTLQPAASAAAALAVIWCSG